MPLIVYAVHLSESHHSIDSTTITYVDTLLIGASLSEPHIDWHNGPRGGECFNLSIYLSRGSVCPFQCSREVGNALFSTCAHYTTWRLVSNKIPGILAGNDADDSGTTTTEIRDT